MHLRSRNDLNHNRLEKRTLHTHISYLLEQPRGNTYELITVCTPDLEVHLLYKQQKLVHSEKYTIYIE